VGKVNDKIFFQIVDFPHCARLAFVGVVAWLASIATDFWVIVVGQYLLSSVIRCFILRSNIPIWVYFGEPLNDKMLVSFIAIWYNLWQFGIMYDRLV
jgi:hypothetical protein